jgi:amino acid transporter
VCYLAYEIRDPGRVVPRAIMFSISTVGTLYILMTTCFLSVIPWQRVHESKFIASEFIEVLQGAAAGKAMTALILWIAFSSAFSLLLGYSRIPYVAATDGNFFGAFARLHPKGDFPYVSLVTLGILASVFSLFKLSEVIPSLIATRVLIQYLPQTVGFFLLRFRAPELHRPFRMWFYPLPGIVSVLGWLYVLATSNQHSLVFAFGVLLVGTILYMIRSKVRREWPFEGGRGQTVDNRR